MFRRVVFGSVIGQIFCAFFPMHIKLALPHPVTQPVKAHVHRLRSLLVNFVVEDVSSTLVVELDGGWALVVAHFDEGIA